jgi:hypothetical protein
LQPVVLAALQGKGLCGKEAYLLKAFLVTSVATKVTGPPATKSGYTTGHLQWKLLRCSQ